MKRDVFTCRECNGFRCRENCGGHRHVQRRPSWTGDGKPIAFVSDGDVARFLSKRHSTYTDPVALIMLTESSSDDFTVKAAKITKMRAYDIATHGVISIDVHTDIREVCRIWAKPREEGPCDRRRPARRASSTEGDIAHSMRKYLEQNESS